MIIPFILLFGAIGYVYYNSKEEVSLVEVNQIDKTNKQNDDDDDLFNNLEDLFI